MTEEQIKQKAHEYWIKGTSFALEDFPIVIQQAYIAGATENGIQWHDLRKDPNDLPKEKETVVAIYENNALRHKILTFYRDKKWVNIFGAYRDIVSPIIAWCEIPQFKE